MMFDIKKDPEKVIILATGEGWQLAPKESEKTVFALNDFIYQEKYGVRPDVLFMMDILDEKPQVVSGVQSLGETVRRINGMRVPFVGPYKYEEIPLSEAFPIRECAKEFGQPYFSNTIGYMIAYALLAGAKELELYGVNQAGSHEYAEEKGGVEYWLGIAVGKGLKVTINGRNSQLLRYKGRYGNDILYGYLMSYKQITQLEDKFGPQSVRKLTKPSEPFERTVEGRKIT